MPPVIEPTTESRIESLRSLREQNPSLAIRRTPLNAERLIPKTLSREYARSFYEHFQGNGGMSAALEEGTNTAGGFAVPLVVEPQIIPFAPSDLAIRNLATVIPTVCDRRFARTTALPSAAIKSEGSSFSASTGTLGTLTLSAFMISVEQDASVEIFEDVPLFNETVLRDSGLALQVLEETKFLSGTGSGEPQGLIGQVGPGISGVLAGSDTYASELLTATFDVQATVKAQYLRNSAYLMSRATANVLKKAQVGSGYFEHVFTRDADGTERLNGCVLAYSDSMPSIGAGNTPVLFGDFKSAYIIGDRGGSAISMKIINESATNVLNGIVTLLVFRRTDGRVRIPEAVQAITLHS